MKPLSSTTLVAGRWRWRARSAFGGTLLIALALACQDRPPSMGPNAVRGVEENLLPGSVPRGHYDVSNLVVNHRRSPFKFVRDIVTILFYPSASAADRKSAVDSIGGSVIGGVRLGRHNSIYLVRIPPDDQNDRVFDAISKVRRMRGVRLAGPDYVMVNPLAYQRPNDGAAWHREQWNVLPESAYANLDSNWAFEAIAAPWAWGCETGSPNTKVAVIDMGIHGVADLLPNIAGASDTFSTGVDTVSHGTQVASIVGAVGNNDTGITGMMWHAKLQLADITLRDSMGGVSHPYEFPYSSLFHAVTAVAESGARVINLSLQAHVIDTTGYGASVAYFDSMFVAALETAGAAPLIVIAAGNDGKSTPPMNDTYWDLFATLKNVLPNQTLVVAAGGTAKNSLDSSSSIGSLVDVAAPGQNVGVLAPTGPHRNSGTSFAAPFVTGLAGLLLSFDSTLTISEVRQLIIDGADSSGLLAGSYHLINAYKSLQLAAQRSSAPLCGNRVVIGDGGTIIVRRGAYNADTIARNQPIMGSLPLYHHGRRIDLGDSMIVHSGGTWHVVEYVYDSTETLSGTFWSGLGYSHDADTLAWLHQDAFQPSPPVVGVDLVTSAGSTHISAISGFLPNYDGVSHDNYVGGYSSVGNVFIVPIRASFGDPSVTMYSVNTRTGVTTALSGWSEASAYVVGVQVSEDGQFASVSFSPDIYQTSCKIDYRRLAAPSVIVDTMTISYGGACYSYGSPMGGFSPSRRANLTAGRVHNK